MTWLSKINWSRCAVGAAQTLGLSEEESRGYSQRPKLLLWLLVPGIGVPLFMRPGLKVRKENLKRLQEIKKRTLRRIIGKRLLESEHDDTYTQRPPSDTGAGSRY